MQYLGTIDKAKDIINKDFVEKLLGDYQPLINESSKLPYSLISGVPTSLPASDVYPWAKASTKPSYSYSEITGAISTTELQNYLTQNSYLNVTEGDNRYLMLSGGTINGKLAIKNSTREVLDIISTDIYGPLVKLCYYNNVALSSFGHIRKATESNLGAYWMNNESGCGIMLGSDGKTYIFTNQTVKAEHEIWHKGNFTPSNYLPLSGGTISNNGYALILNRESESPAWIQFRTQNEFVGAIGGENGALRFMDKKSIVNTIWHSGNDGSGSGLDADLLDGKHLSDIIRYEGFSNNAFQADTPQTITYWTEGNSGYGYTYGTALNIQGAGSWNHRLAFRTDGKIDYYQGINTGDMSYIGQLAFTSSNVASATKLQTARTIWGQSFDGTGNVSGVISNTHTIEFDTSLGAANIGYLWTNTRGMHMDMSGLGTEQQGTNLTLTRYGNVGIGIPSPNYKLHVLGQILAQDGELISYNIINGSTVKKGGFLQLVGYYTPTSEAWSAYIASDYLGAQWCTTGGFTHGMIFKSGRSGFDNFIFLDSSGNPVARISSSNAGMNHHFVGDMLVTGGITMYSDQRKKTILNHVELSLKQIAEAPLIEHYYNGDDKKTTHVGSIAQYWYNFNDWFCKKDSEGYLTMEIQNAALASAISIARELDRYETKTDKAIKKLKKRICELEEEVERLKSA